MNVSHAQDHLTGLVFTDEQSYRSIPLAATPLLGIIPNEIDLSSKFPIPGDQGDQGSCVGWAVAYALKSYHEETERQWGLDTNKHLFSPSFIYNQIKLSDCRGGSTYIDALNLLRRDGVAVLSDFPYTSNDCSKQPSNADRQKARHFAVADWRRVNVQDEVEIKTQLASGFPVLIGMIVDDVFKKLGPGTYEKFTGPNLGGHAVVVVGYSDQKKAFKIINSWGTGWGDNGYGWLSYSGFRSVTREGYIVQDIVAIAPPKTTTHSNLKPELKPKLPDVVIQTPTYLHNVQVPATNGFGSALGMKIFINGNIQNALGKTAQIVVKFNYQNGPPLNANSQDMNFRDISGLVATGTPLQIVGSNTENLTNLQITIPYYALNFMPTGGQRTYLLTLTAYVYLDNAIVAQSVPVGFSLTW